MRQAAKTCAFYCFLSGFCLLCLLPIIMMVITSLKNKAQIMGDLSTFLFVPTLQNYQIILNNHDWLHFLYNSLIVGIASTIITLIFGAMAAYALVRWDFYGRSLINGSTLLVRMLPPAVMTIPVFIIWTFQYNLSNSLSGLLLVYTAINIPFVIWILQSFITQIPKEICEAARIDGANEWQIFYHLILPTIQPGLAAAAIFTFRIVWNEFILALILTNHDTRTMPVNISLLNGSHNTDWGQIMALGVLIAIPPVIFTFIASKQIIAGMTAGSIKG